MHPPVRLVAIDMDGTLLPTFAQTISARTAQALRAAQQAGITVAIATGRRTAYTVAAARRPGSASGYASDYVQWCSDPHAGRRADRPLPPGGAGGAGPLRAVAGRLARWSLRLTGRGAGELVLEDMEQAQGRISLWVEANRNAIEVVKPLENALPDGETRFRAWLPERVEQDAAGRASA